MPASTEEMQRWSAPKVEAYRRSMTKYIYVNAVIILGAPWINLLFWTVIHSIVMP